MKVRSGSRRTLERWAGISRELGDREFNLAKLAEAQKNSAEAKSPRKAAQKYYEQLADISKKLAVSPDLMSARSNYGHSFYALRLVQKYQGKQDEARASFERSRDIRAQFLRDFSDHPYLDHLKIDLLFSLVALVRTENVLPPGQAGQVATCEVGHGL